MLEKNFFKASTISYSRFLQSKKPQVHCLTEAKECVDIDFFRRSISLHYQHAYATQKWKNWIYRFIFIGLGLLFLALGMIIFFKTVNFACTFYFKNSQLVKNSVNMVCLLFATGAFTLGYKIHPEKEAMQYLIGKVARELNDPTKHLQIEFNAIISNFSHQTIGSQNTIWIKKFF